MSHPTAPSPPVPSFSCPVGVRHRPTHGILLWARSPRTGKVIEVVQARWSMLPNRLAARITSAASIGRHELFLTREELLSLKAMAIAEAPPVQVGPTPAQRSAAASLDRRMTFRRCRGFRRGW